MIDFKSIPEYEIFKDLTTMNEFDGRDIIDVEYQNKYFDKKDIKTVFQQYLEYFKQNGFEQLCEQYIDISTNRSYRNMSSIHAYNNFKFNHPMVAMSYMFIEYGFLTRELQYNPDRLLIPLGAEVLPKTKLRDMNISEGIIFDDGTLMPIKSNKAHKIGALWVFLNNKSVKRMVRYTSDCINPEPIYTSLSEYVKMSHDNICITEEQAIAMYNIHTLKSTKDFESVLENSRDVCITYDGDADIRLKNAKTFERALGKDVFDCKEVLYNLKSKSYLY